MAVKERKNLPEKEGKRIRHASKAHVTGKRVTNKQVAKLEKNKLKEYGWSIQTGSGEIISIEAKSYNTHFFQIRNLNVYHSLSWDGFKFSEVEPMIDFLDFNQKESAAFLEVDPGTISRWRKSPKLIGRLRSKNLLNIDEIIAKGVRIFGGEESLKEWLNTTNYALGDIAPIELLKDPYGVELVEEAIESLSWGSFA